MRMGKRTMLGIATVTFMAVTSAFIPAHAAPISKPVAHATQLSTQALTAYFDPGWYPWGTVFTIKRANGKCLEIENSSTALGARAQQWECKNQPGMYWYVRDDTMGHWHIISRSSGLSLEIEGSSYNNGARAQQWAFYNGTGEEWTFPSGPSGSTYIVNGSGKCLEIENSSYDNGARAQQWDCVGQTGAQWQIQPAPSPYN
jgi:hypothetical protein